MSRSETNKAPTSRLQYLGDIRHPIFKINKNSKWANKTSLKQNNITDQSLTGNSLKGSELFFKDKVLSNFQITISKQIKQYSDSPK